MVRWHHLRVQHLLCLRQAAGATLRRVEPATLHCMRMSGGAALGTQRVAPVECTSRSHAAPAAWQAAPHPSPPNTSTALALQDTSPVDQATAAPQRPPAATTRSLPPLTKRPAARPGVSAGQAGPLVSAEAGQLLPGVPARPCLATRCARFGWRQLWWCGGVGP